MSVRVAEFPIGWTVLVDCGVWAIGGTLAGYLTHKLGDRPFDHDGPLTRLRPFEQDGRRWERWLRVKRWKHRLPEAGDLFDGGFSKKRLATGDVAYLEQFVTETRRAEVTHWIVMAMGPFFFLWNPPWLAAVMVAYGVVANLPCLIIQRYNRARLQRVIARAARRRASAGSAEHVRSGLASPGVAATALPPPFELAPRKAS